MNPNNTWRDDCQRDESATIGVALKNPVRVEFPVPVGTRRLMRTRGLSVTDAIFAAHFAVAADKIWDMARRAS